MNIHRRSKLRLLCLILALYEVSPASVRPVHAQKAMVVSVHHAASDAGIAVLKAGGNAVDAAVATGFALAVVHPAAGNIGGGGFMLVRMAKGETHFLDYREKAPAAATRDMYLDGQGNVIKDMSTVGYQAIAVPGSVAGMALAQKRWGKLPLVRVLEPAIQLAEQGFDLSYEETQELKSEKLSKFAESKRIFQRDGNFYKPGEIFRQPELAQTLRQIAQSPDDFYHGELARRVTDFVRRAGGLITAADLANYEVKERQPVRGTYRDYEIISAPPPSSGGITLLESLNILEGYNLHQLGNRSADSIHLTVEAYKRAFMDRAEFLGDPDFSKIPVAQLIDKKYASAFRETINPQRTTSAKDVRRPARVFNELDRVSRLTYLLEADHTTHYSVVDEQGNAVAVTTTLNGSFGSYVTVEGLGFLLNNEMDDFAAKQGVPNAYGLIQGPANAIEPNKRPLSAMAPTMVLQGGALFMVLGSPGGPRIITTVANILMGVIDYGLDIQRSVNAPRFHHQWLPDEVYLEPGFSPDTLKLLRDKGHVLKVSERNYWSDGECILIDPRTGERLGGHDDRQGYGKAAGY